MLNLCGIQMLCSNNIQVWIKITMIIATHSKSNYPVGPYGATCVCLVLQCIAIWHDVAESESEYTYLKISKF